MSFRRKIFTGFIWQAVEQFGMRIVQFVVAILLARLLEPDEFGMIALISIFLFFASLLVDSGFGKALIQKRDVQDIDYNSIFYINLSIGVIIYLILFFAAPYIANFYDRPILLNILRWSGLGIFINAFNVVQNAILEREMRFNCACWITLVSMSFSSTVGVYMAYAGFGVWSLVFSGLIGNVSGTIVRWIIVGWRPSLSFSFLRVRELFSFGVKLLASWTIGAIVNQSYGPIIGKCYSVKDLAFFNRGESLPATVMGSVEAVVAKVMFPALSSVQNNEKKLLGLTRRMMSFNTMLIFPVMMGLAALADPIIRFLLTDKWIAAVPFLQLTCIFYACRPINVANVQVLQACGEGIVYLKLEIIKMVIGLLLLILLLRYGVVAIAVGRVLSAVLAVLINMKPSSRIIGYTYKMQFRDLFPYILASAIMGSILWLIASNIVLNPFCLLLILIPFGALLYVVLLWLMKADAFFYAINLLRRRI